MKIYYSDTEISPFLPFFGLKRQLPFGRNKTFYGGDFSQQCVLTLERKSTYFAVSSFPLVLTSQVTTTAPNLAILSAIRRPIPEPPPVINTISPAILFSKAGGYTHLQQVKLIFLAFFLKIFSLPNEVFQHVVNGEEKSSQNT